MRIFSEDSHNAHLMYLRDLRLKLSILEKSEPRIRGLTPKQILGCGAKADLRRDAALLSSEILLHDIAMGSYREEGSIDCAPIRNSFGSAASFIYEATRLAMSCRAGFLAVYNERGRVVIRASEDHVSLVTVGEPFLAVDLWEHAYFTDYGFDKHRYLSAILPVLDSLALIC